MRTGAEGRRWPLTVLAVLPLLGACAAGPVAEPAGGPPAGVPGFDTRAYPGDGVMQQWRETSPYQWVGYYLAAPCHPHSTWKGRRQAQSGRASWRERQHGAA